MSVPPFDTPEAMRDLLERVVKHAGHDSNDPRPRWSHVSSIVMHGSGYSAAICREFGADPDEVVGGLQDGKYCKECGYCQGCLSHHYEACKEDCEYETEASA